MKLNPEELDVTSFDTTDSGLAATQPIIATDPTAATRCFICPMETYNCY